MLLHLREMLLIQNGFAVTSVCGNAEARRLLAQEAPFADLPFAVGNTAEIVRLIVR